MAFENLSHRAARVFEDALVFVPDPYHALDVPHVLRVLGSDPVVQLMGAEADVNRFADSMGEFEISEEEADEGGGMSPALFETLNYANALASAMNDPYITPAHLCLAFAELGLFPRTASEVRQAMAVLAQGQKVEETEEVLLPNPLDELSVEDTLQMEERLHHRLIGQHHAVSATAHAIRRSIAGLSDEHRPLGSFLFLGPTGVGKTELSKALAEFLYGSEQALCRFDMSEYMEQHTVAKFIGSPPGYVGFNEGGQLTNAIARNPYSVVLLDEMEKAHPDVLNILLQLLDDGRLTDGHGNTVDFRHTVVIMTSNVGSQFYRDQKVDPVERKTLVLETLWSQFRPEFLNRIDELLVFDPLTREDFRSIVELQLAPIIAQMSRRGIEMEIAPEAKSYLAEGGYNPVLGARQLRRFIQKELQNPLATMVIQAQADHGRCVVGVNEERLAIELEV